jgi:transposase
MAKRKKKELSMRKIREVLRLRLSCNMGFREIARSCSISHTTVGQYLSRAEESGLTYEEIEKMDDGKLVVLLKKNSVSKDKESRPQPDWSWVHQELKKKGVTLQLLWEEYKEIHPDGYQISQFYEHYNRWKNKLDVTLRQTHKAGEKMFIDYAGQIVPVIDRSTGQIREAQLFVAVLGASNYTYAESTWGQGISDWIGCHVRAFEYFGGVARIIVPDNLKSGVTKPCRYEPDINPTYNDLAVHYGTVIIPARVRKPKDKAKVEVGVQIAERWILAALRNWTFFSLTELNKAIVELLEKLNHRPFKKLEGSRRSWFETMERSALLALPGSPYVFAEWKKARVNIDYHVELNRHYYSVPYTLVQEEVEVRYTNKTVEIFYRQKRVASHMRDDRPGKHTTLEEHMPKSHQKYLQWTPSRIIRWAATVGESTAKVVETIMNSRRHPEQGYRSCMGIMRLGKQYSNERLEAACGRALVLGTYGYKSIRSILEKRLDQQPLSHPKPYPPIDHKNIRGCDYFVSDNN